MSRLAIEGHKVISNASESFFMLLTDGSLSLQEKALYKPPAGVSPNMWRDCWIIRAPSADGCSGRYVVAASAGNTMDSGFCSWDFYAKDVCAFHIDDGLAPSRTVLGPLPDKISYRRNTLSNLLDIQKLNNGGIDLVDLLLSHLPPVREL